MPHSPEHFQNLRNALQAELLRYFDSTTIDDYGKIVASKGNEGISVPISTDDLERSFGSDTRLQRQASFMAHAAAIRFERSRAIYDHPAVLLSGDTLAIPANQAFLPRGDGEGPHFPAKEGAPA